MSNTKYGVAVLAIVIALAMLAMGCVGTSEKASPILQISVSAMDEIYKQIQADNIVGTRELAGAYYDRIEKTPATDPRDIKLKKDTLDALRCIRDNDPAGSQKYLARMMVDLEDYK